MRGPSLLPAGLKGTDSMASVKKKRKAKINRHKRKKQRRQNRHKKK